MLQRGEVIPFNSFKEKIRIVKDLERKFKKVKIEVEDWFIYYEYLEPEQ